MEQYKPISTESSTVQVQDERSVITHLEEHLRPLVDHQGVGMPHWYYW